MQDLFPSLNRLCYGILISIASAIWDLSCRLFIYDLGRFRFVNFSSPQLVTSAMWDLDYCRSAWDLCISYVTSGKQFVMKLNLASMVVPELRIEVFPMWNLGCLHFGILIANINSALWVHNHSAMRPSLFSVHEILVAVASCLYYMEFWSLLASLLCETYASIGRLRYGILVASAMCGLDYLHYGILIVTALYETLVVFAMWELIRLN